MNEFPWMDWMTKHIGEEELAGSKPTPFDEEVFSHTDFGPLDEVMQAACAATACCALEEAGYLSPHNAGAISFINYGTPCELIPGAIVVFKWNSGHHHVSFCHHIIDERFVACLGGNQSGMLKLSVYPRDFIVATRWPVKAH